MLRRIRIRGYKSLAEVSVELQPLTVLFGPNAAGKSNFLDALQLLSRTAVSHTLKEAFEPPYRGTPLESFTFPRNGVQGLLKQESASFSIEVDVEISPAVARSVDRQVGEMKRARTAEEGEGPRKKTYVRRRLMRYRLELEILPKSGILRVADEYLAALTPTGEPTKSPMPFLERVGNRLHLRMERQAHPTYYEPGLDHTILSRPLYPPHYPHVVAMKQELASWLFFYFEPRQRMRAANLVKEVRHIGLMGEDLASYLNTLRAVDEAQFRALEQTLQSVIPSVTGIDVGVNSQGEVELKLIEGGMPVPSRVLSEGTLRVLGLLALGGVKEPPGLIGFEEPENGVHPGRIRRIAELLTARAGAGDTQLIVTTHSPILPDMIPDQFLYVCSRAKGHTRVEPFSSWGALGRKPDIERVLDTEEEALPVSQRILRGDFDAAG
jgi:predicted ATPase